MSKNKDGAKHPKKPQPIDVVKATEFCLVDRKGKPRAVLGFSNDGEPALELFDKSGELRASLSLLSGEVGSWLVFYDEIGRRQAELCQSELNFYDSKGHLRTEISVSEEGEFTRLVLFDEKEQPRSALILGYHAGPVFALVNKDGATVWQAPNEKEDEHDNDEYEDEEEDDDDEDEP